MFLLTDKDRARTILGCGDGPASFNAELSRAGGSVVSVDPIYRFSREKIRQRIVEAYPQVMAQLSRNFSDYLWTKLGGVEELGQIRMQAMEMFLSDYEAGKKTGRYLATSLPTLPFMDKAFDLALCSHYLFLYSAHIDPAGIRHRCWNSVVLPVRCVYIRLSTLNAKYHGILRRSGLCLKKAAWR